jgi:hypothetical protein
VHELILNGPQLKKSLKDFADVIEADEILLFEKTTFLVSSLECILKRFFYKQNVVLVLRVSHRLQPFLIMT